MWRCDHVCSCVGVGCEHVNVQVGGGGCLSVHLVMCGHMHMLMGAVRQREQGMCELSVCVSSSRSQGVISGHFPACGASLMLRLQPCWPSYKYQVWSPTGRCRSLSQPHRRTQRQGYTHTQSFPCTTHVHKCTQIHTHTHIWKTFSQQDWYLRPKCSCTWCVVRLRWSLAQIGRAHV